jgi:hypothetical protein
MRTILPIEIQNIMYCCRFGLALSDAKHDIEFLRTEMVRRKPKFCESLTPSRQRSFKQSHGSGDNHVLPVAVMVLLVAETMLLPGKWAETIQSRRTVVRRPVTDPAF